MKISYSITEEFPDGAYSITELSQSETLDILGAVQYALDSLNPTGPSWIQELHEKLQRAWLTGDSK